MSGRRLREIRHVRIHLQYHYLGPESRLERDFKASRSIKDVFHPDAVIELSVAVHLPVSPESLALEGREARPLEARWILDNHELDFDVRQASVLKIRDAMDELDQYYHGTHGGDLVAAMITHAPRFLVWGAQSFMTKPFFGPALPPVMEAVREKEEREKEEREKRELEWDAQQERDREAACGED